MTAFHDWRQDTKKVGLPVVHHRAIKRGQYGLISKKFNFKLFWGDYNLRWWRLPIEERACRKTDLGVGDYYLRNSGLPPLCGHILPILSA